MRGLGTLSALVAPVAAALADGPFTTSGRWILAGDNKTNVNLAGINWPGAGEAMIPEGLQYQSAAAIAARIQSLGMNVVRLTYATEMVDQIFANGGADIPVQKSLIAALGQQNGTAVWEMVKRSNPQFNDNITRLQVSFEHPSAFLLRQELVASASKLTNLSFFSFVLKGVRYNSCRIVKTGHLRAGRQPCIQGPMVLFAPGWQLLVGRHVLFDGQLDAGTHVHD